MGKNGTQSSGGAIFFGKNCEIVISDTVINGSQAMWTVPTVAYAGGDGGNGGAGGSDGGSGGNAGGGGDGGPAGAAGTAGAAGNQGAPGQGGTGGQGATSVTTNLGGAIFYSEGCKATLTNCTLNSNRVENQSGGASYYSRNCTTQIERCSMGSNTAGLNGGALAFDIDCKATILGSTFLSNTAAADGGAVYCWYRDEIDVNDSAFGDNRATGALSSGGAIYAGGTYDDKVQEWYNGGTVRLKKTQFATNAAAFGGALVLVRHRCRHHRGRLHDPRQRGPDGGGLYWSGGAARIVNCSIRGNAALGPQYQISLAAPTPDPNDPNTWPPSSTWPDPNDPNSMFDPNNPFTPPPIQVPKSTELGAGGGLVCWSSDASIEDSFISENTVNGSGGGVYFGGDPFTPQLKNCLVKDNTALIGGGGIASYWYAAPTISNCTIVGNKATDPNNSSHGYGGGLFASYASDTTLLDSIVWGNTAVQGGQIALGSQSDPIYIQRPAIVTIRFSDVQNGLAGIHVEQGATVNWLPGDIDADPLFVGSYFLSQTAAGQAQTSPAVDAGSDSAQNLGLAGYTTRTDGVGDQGKVDMGFHYPARGPLPAHGQRRRRPRHGPAAERPVPRVPGSSRSWRRPSRATGSSSWTGTDKDPSWNKNTNTVTMNTGANRFVTVEFEKDVINTLLVPADFRTIEDAVKAAGPGGNKIVLSRGTHVVTDPNGIDFQGKIITVMLPGSRESGDRGPDDHRLRGSRLTPRRAFHFHSGEDANCRDHRRDDPQRLRQRSLGGGRPIRRPAARTVRYRGSRCVGSAAASRRTRVAMESAIRTAAAFSARTAVRLRSGTASLPTAPRPAVMAVSAPTDGPPRRSPPGRSSGPICLQ